MDVIVFAESAGLSTYPRNHVLGRALGAEVTCDPRVESQSFNVPVYSLEIFFHNHHLYRLVD